MQLSVCQEGVRDLSRGNQNPGEDPKVELPLLAPGVEVVAAVAQGMSGLGKRLPSPRCPAARPARPIHPSTMIPTVCPTNGFSSGRCRVSESNVVRMRLAFMARPRMPPVFYRPRHIRGD